MSPEQVVAAEEAMELEIEDADKSGRVKWKEKMSEDDWIDYSEHARENPNWYVPLYGKDGELVAYMELLDSDDDNNN